MFCVLVSIQTGCSYLHVSQQKEKQENPISVYWLKGRDSKNG